MEAMQDFLWPAVVTGMGAFSLPLRHTHTDVGASSVYNAFLFMSSLAYDFTAVCAIALPCERITIMYFLQRLNRYLSRSYFDVVRLGI